MLRYIFLTAMLFLVLPSFSQIQKPDTLFFKQGRILPCKILDVSRSEITVLSEPSEPDYPWSYPVRKIALVSNGGTRDSVTVFLERFMQLKRIEKEKSQATDSKNSLFMAGKLQTKAANNLIFSDILLIGSSLSSAWSITATEQNTQQMALVVAAGTGLLGIIMRFVGHSQLSRSGELLMQISPGYSVSTRGNNLVFRF